MHTYTHICDEQTHGILRFNFISVLVPSVSCVYIISYWVHAMVRLFSQSFSLFLSSPPPCCCLFDSINAFLLWAALCHLCMMSHHRNGRATSKYLLYSHNFPFKRFAEFNRNSPILNDLLLGQLSSCEIIWKFRFEECNLKIKDCNWPRRRGAIDLRQNDSRSCSCVWSKIKREWVRVVQPYKNTA